MNREELKELIRQELEEALYAHPSKHKGGWAHPGSQPHVKDAKKNAKKKKKTREGVVQEHDRQDILKHLIKKGSNPKDAEKLLDKHYDYLEKRYKRTSVAKKAEVLVTLGALDAGR